jgi:hypothetical protein
MTQERYQWSEQALSADVGEDVVALHVANGACFGMEKVASHVWKMLDRPTGLDAICEELHGRYEVDPDVCHAEVRKLIDQLVREGLVEVAA